MAKLTINEDACKGCGLCVRCMSQEDSGNCTRKRST